MVHLSISALRGNQGGRTYPYAGYLGLSKLTVEGVVRTRVEDDNRLLPASSITISIRCYEARTRFAISKVNVLVDATQTLWSAAEGLEYEDLGGGDYPFRISLPSKVGGLSTMQHPDYRIFWRLEAAINHLPLLGLGTRQLRSYDLILTRYDFPEPAPSSSSPYLAFVPKDPDTFLHTFQPSGPLAHLPPCQYRIILPSSPIGPSSSLAVAVALHLPASPSSSSPPVAVHSVSVILERRMDFYEASGVHSSPELLSGTATTTPEASPAASRTSFRSTATHSPSSSFGSSTLTFGRKRSASASPAAVLAAKSLTTTIATAESTLGSTGGGARRSAELTIDLAVPPRPPPSQWPLGESTRTELAAIVFYVRMKIGVILQSQSQPAPSSSSSSAAPTVYEYELPEREVQMVSVTEEERAHALARIAERRSRSGACSRRASTGAADAVPTLTADGGAGAGADTGVPPLPKGASAIKFGVEDALNSGVSAAMLNSRLKNVKASRDVAGGPVAGPPSASERSGSAGSSVPGSSSGSSSYSSMPSSASSSASPALPTPPTPRSKTPVGVRRPQTTSGAPPSAHNNKASKQVRRTHSDKASYRPQSEVVSVLELDSARQHGVFLAPDWKERGERKAERGSGSGSGSSASGSSGSKSDSEAKVRAHKDRSSTATAMNAFDAPPPVPSKDRTTPMPPQRTIPPSPTRPLPPPPPPSAPSYPSFSSASASPFQSPLSLSPSLSPSPPGSTSGHGHGHGHGHGQIPRASVNLAARSSPNLLDPTSSDSSDRGRNRQRRPRGNSNVSSRGGKILNAILSAMT